jgi:RnfABCDGE-type electron transport complex B subunit
MLIAAATDVAAGSPILTALVFLFGLGLAASVILAVASKVFYVKEDPRIMEIENVLPGANCGGCGFPGCSGCARAIVAKKAPTNTCVVGGNEVAMEVAPIMGLAVEFKEPEVAIPDCTGGKRATNKYKYEGAYNCRAQALLFGGDKECAVGCLGLGSCVDACQFGAIKMGPDGYPVVNIDKCVACGKCAEVCPRGVISILNNTARILHMNEVTDCLAPCRQACPAQVDIPRYIEQIKNGEFAAAILTLKERNPFILSCGRVCPHPCEDECRRQLADDPVGINFLKRYVADWEMQTGIHVKIPVAPETGKKVAVVGGGPAGLSCAFVLKRLGHSPTVFDMMPELGGMLRYGIPEYRLPKKVLDWDIGAILELGVEVKKNTRFGRDFTIRDLRDQGFEAVFLGIGAWVSASLRLENEDAEGVIGGIDFLNRVGLGEKMDLGSRVVVIGGGNVAVDVARTVNRLGADKVTMVVLESRAEMPAWDVEVEGALAEGVEIINSVGPKSLPVADGRVTGIELKKCTRVFDEEGRFSPSFDESVVTRIESDSVILAIGQRPDASYNERETDETRVETTRWNTIVANENTCQTMIPYVFTAGDIHTGPDLAVTAIGGGRRAARGIHYFLMQGEIPVPENLQKGRIPETMFEEIEGVSRRGRVTMPELPINERLGNMREVDLTISREDAKHECGRCMRCGLLCYDKDKVLI